uniref:Uncharacterized protein n=1 Tax=Meloidogyne incognita TaxID=6306 RepID=A0A914KLR6_MELIC
MNKQQQKPARFSQTTGSIKTSSGSPSLFGTSSTSVKLQQQLHSASSTPKVLSTPKPLSTKDLTKVVDANPFNMEDLVTLLDDGEIDGIQISTQQKNLEPDLQNTPARFSQTAGSIKTSSGSPSLFGTSSTSVKLQQQLHSASNTPKVLSTPKPLSTKDLTKVVDANPFNMEDLVTPLDEDEIVNLEPVKIVSDNPNLSAERKRTMEHANKHHFLNTIGIVLASVASHHPKVTSTLFALGALLFCGPSYAYAIEANKTFRAITPIGGILSMFAWLSFIL